MTEIIKCPHCGSPSYTEIRPDTYQCQHCDSAFSTGSGENHIQHTHVHTVHYAPDPSRRKQLIICVVLLLLFVVIMAIQVKLRTERAVERSQLASKQYRSAPKPFLNWRTTESTLFSDGKDNTFIVGIGVIRTNLKNIDSKERYVSVIDAITGKSLSLQSLGRGPADVLMNSVAMQTWDNGDLMLIVDKKTLYRMDKETKTFEPVGESYFSGHKVFSAGLAQIEFMSVSDGSGLRIYTNDGLRRYFYPLVNGVYHPDTFYKAYSETDSVPKDSPVMTGFHFTSTINSVEETPIKLIRYQHKNAKGYPRMNVVFRREKNVLPDGLRRQGRIVSFADFTPGRTWFTPRVLGFDDNHVLVAFRVVPSGETPLVLQLLNARTAETVWSYHTEWRSHQGSSARFINNRVIVQNQQEILVLNDRGKKISAITQNEGHKNGTLEYFQKTAGNSY